MSEQDRFLTESGTLVNATMARINPAKPLGYALDPNHPRGGHKALVFQRVLGDNRGNASELEAMIRDGILTTEARAHHSERHGLEFIVDLVIRGPSGREAVVRTEWMYETDDDFPSLTTVFIRRRRPRGQTSTS
jgi:hypothetical protein